MFTGPKIITEDLIIYLDVGNTKSYPTSGSSLFDLSKNNNNAEIISGVTYDISNNGILVFNGLNGRIDFDILNTLNNSTDFTLDMWVNSSSVSTEQFLISNVNTTISKGWNVELYNSRFIFQVWPSGIYKQTNTTYNSNTWYNLNITYNIGVVNIYVNGSSIPTTNVGGSDFTFTNSDYNTFFSFFPYTLSSGLPFSGKLSTTKIYSRALSATEILQNYNATKSRFGL